LRGLSRSPRGRHGRSGHGGRSRRNGNHGRHRNINTNANIDNKCSSGGKEPANSPRGKVLAVGPLTLRLVIDDRPDNCVNVDLLNAGCCEALVSVLVKTSTVTMDTLSRQTLIYCSFDLLPAPI